MTDQVGELTLRGTSTGWRKGLSGTPPPHSTNGRTNSSSWADVVSLHARGQLAEKQLGREGFGSSGGCQADCGPEMCLCGKDGQWDPELL